MNKERLEMLKKYLEAGISPLLIQNIDTRLLTNIVSINSGVDISQLNGHYENIEFCPPEWYKELLKKSETGSTTLVIENINEIPIEEQTKFIEILKYKKVSTFDLPKNCLIIVTCTDLNINKINEEVYSLLVQI